MNTETVCYSDDFLKNWWEGILPYYKSLIGIQYKMPFIHTSEFTGGFDESVETLRRVYKEAVTIPIKGAKSKGMYISAGDENYMRCFSLYSEKYVIEPILGTSVDLQNLKPNQRVCYGDGILYHFLLTEKK